MAKSRAWAYFALIFLASTVSAYSYAIWGMPDPVERSDLNQVFGIVKSVRDVSQASDRGKRYLHFTIERDDGSIATYDTRTWDFDRFKAEPLKGKRASALVTPDTHRAYDLEVDGQRFISFEASYNDLVEQRRIHFMVGHALLVIVTLLGAASLYHAVREQTT